MTSNKLWNLDWSFCYRFKRLKSASPSPTPWTPGAKRISRNSSLTSCSPALKTKRTLLLLKCPIPLRLKCQAIVHRKCPSHHIVRRRFQSLLDVEWRWINLQVFVLACFLIYTFNDVQWGLEYRTSSVFGWSIVVRLSPNHSKSEHSKWLL